MSEHALRPRTAPGRARLAPVAALLCALAGCGGGTRAGFVATNPPPRPLRPRLAAEVALIAPAGDPGATAGATTSATTSTTTSATTSDPALARPHVEVGLVEVLGDGAWGAAEQAAMRERLRARAAEHGCDAVVLLGEIDWVYVIENAHSTAERHGYRGVCIVYR